MKKFKIDDNHLPESDRIAYSPDEAARAVGFSRNGLYAYIASGELRSFKVGRKKRLILRADLLAFVERTARADAATAARSCEETDGSAE